MRIDRERVQWANHPLKLFSISFGAGLLIAYTMTIMFILEYQSKFRKGTNQDIRV